MSAHGAVSSLLDVVPTLLAAELWGWMPVSWKSPCALGLPSTLSHVIVRTTL